jgi:alkylation response protein AidB-like acyl-CoA dehydrogenase
MSHAAAARALQPRIREAADEAERQRRMPSGTARLLAEAGLFRLCVPRAKGGLEADPRTLLEAIEAIAEADASAGWCVMIGATTGLLAGYLPTPLAREIYGDPMTITGGVVAPMGRAEAGPDAYAVTGRWRWTSGGQNCRWLGGGAVIFEDGKARTLPNGAPEHRMMLFPAAEAELIDTWRTAGLCGTGSLDMKVERLRVPRERSVSLVTDKPVADGPLFAFPIFGLLALGIAAVASGNARGAATEFQALAAAKKTGGAGRRLAERAPVQATYARAEAELRAARAFLFDEVDAAWEEARGGGEIPVERRGTLRLAATHMGRVAAEFVRTVQDEAGGPAVFLDNTLQRRLRDAQTMTAHVMIAPASWELAGRVLLGLPTDTSTL